MIDECVECVEFIDEFIGDSRRKFTEFIAEFINTDGSAVVTKPLIDRRNLLIV